MPGGFGYTVEVDGADRVAAALRDAQPTLKEHTVPVMEAAANSIASAAAARAQQHPSGLWKPKRRGRAGAPGYRTKKVGPYWFRVETPGTVGGRAEAVSEFARLATSSQGAAMVGVLTSTYGRPGGSGGGRILWAAADEVADAIVADVAAATADAAAEIERNMGGA